MCVYESIVILDGYNGNWLVLVAVFCAVDVVVVIEGSNVEYWKFNLSITSKMNIIKIKKLTEWVSKTSEKKVEVKDRD